MRHSEANNLPYNNLSEPKEVGGYFIMRESGDNPNLVVKHFDSYEYATLEEITDIANRIQSYLKLIEGTKLAEYIPHTQPVIEKNTHGGYTLSVITEKIKGESVYMLDEGSEEFIQFKEKILEFIEGSVDVYIKSFDGERGKVLELTGIHNFIYGTNLARPQGQKLYYVDAFPVYNIPVATLVSNLHVTQRNANLPNDKINELIDKVYSSTTVEKMK